MKLVMLVLLSGVAMGAIAQAQNATTQLAQGAACFASDPDSAGATDAERAIRGAIRKNFEHDAAPGADGKTTINFQTLQIGKPRAWGPAEMGVFSTGDQTKPLYDVHAVFTTCIDYRHSINTVQRDRVFVCPK